MQLLWIVGEVRPHRGADLLLAGHRDGAALGDEAFVLLLAVQPLPGRGKGGDPRPRS